MGELKKLKDLNDEHMLQKILDYEDEQVRIKDIFTRINDAREKFDVGVINLSSFFYGILMSLLPCSLYCASKSSRPCPR